VIGDVMFPCRTGSVSPEDQEIRRRYRLLGALIVDRDESGGRGAGVTLFAWAEQPLVEIDLLDRPQDTDDTTLYIAEFPVTVRADIEAEIPPALTTWTTLPGGVANLTPIQFQLTGADVAEFQFLPLPEMRLDRVSQIDLYFDGQGRLNVEIWDWESDLWRPVALDPNDPITTIGGAARYAGPENAVNVRVSSADTITFHLVDYVKVGYRGSLAAPASRAAAAETARTTG